MNSMNNPILLVLGGGTYQLPVVRTAQGTGLRVAVVDRCPNVPARAVADIFERIDTRNRDAITQFAARLKVSGIIAPCTDVAVPTQAYAAKHLGLPGPPVSSAEILADKIRFRALLDQIALPAPNWQPIDCTNPTSVALDGRLHVLKPAGSSGSKGVFIVEKNSLVARIAETRKFCFEDRAILEEFIGGPQGTVEGLRIGDEFRIALFTDRQTAPAPYVATVGHQVPSMLSANFQSNILRQIARIFAHLSLGDCPFDCDFVVGPEGPYLIELAPRLGGNSLSKLLRLVTGVDVSRAAISLSLAPEARESICAISPKAIRDVAAAIMIFGVDHSGLLDYDEVGLTELQNLDWVEEITFDVRKGTPVNKFINGRERVGEALITANTRQELDRRVAYTKQKLAISARKKIQVTGP
jgi:biotin carboxylase